MNGFERWGIEHLSASSLNKAIASLDSWVISYVFGIKDPSNAAMSRGNAVEMGGHAWLQGGTVEEAVKVATDEFNKLTCLGIDGDSRAKELANIAPMVEQTAAAFGDKRPDIADYQKRVEVEIPGVPIPLMGFTDYGFEDTIVDLKTTMRMPSAIPAAHRRQGAIYRRSGNRAVDFLYVTQKKFSRYRLENDEQDWLEICQAANRLNRWLDKFETREEMAATIIPNYDSFYWNSPQTREKGREIFGY